MFVVTLLDFIELSIVTKLETCFFWFIIKKVAIPLLEVLSARHFIFLMVYHMTTLDLGLTK